MLETTPLGLSGCSANFSGITASLPRSALPFPKKAASTFGNGTIQNLLTRVALSSTFVIHDKDILCLTDMGHFRVADPIHNRVFDYYCFVEIGKVWPASFSRSAVVSPKVKGISVRIDNLG